MIIELHYILDPFVTLDSPLDIINYNSVSMSFLLPFQHFLFPSMYDSVRIMVIKVLFFIK